MSDVAVKYGRWTVDKAPHEGHPPQWEVPITCMACGASNLRWVLIGGPRHKKPDWKLYKIGGIWNGFRLTLHECEGTDPA